MQYIHTIILNIKSQIMVVNRLINEKQLWLLEGNQGIVFQSLLMNVVRLWQILPRVINVIHGDMICFLNNFSIMVTFAL